MTVTSQERAPEEKPKKSPKNTKGEKEIAPPPQAVYGTIEMRNIEISYATPDSVEIKEGLEDGELVTVDIEQELQDKARVEITETQEGIF